MPGRSSARFSTTTGKMFSPPRMMMSATVTGRIISMRCRQEKQIKDEIKGRSAPFILPTMEMYPSPSMMASSPVLIHRTPASSKTTFFVSASLPQ